MRLTSWLVTLVFVVALPALADEPGPLVDVAWIKANAARDDVVLLDIRNEIDGGSAEAFAEGHIPGAVYSNYLEAGWRTEIDGVVGQTPGVKQLGRLIGDLGIDNDTMVVVIPAGVSATDFGSASRIYWTFNHVGHDQVAILDGGYRAWTAEPANPIAIGAPAEPAPKNFAISLRPELLANAAAVRAALDDGGALLLDGRPRQQFQGQAKHEAARAAGHLPGAIHVDHARTFDDQTGRLIDIARLRAAFPQGLLASDQEVLSYCNTGHWASVNWFVLSEILGRKNVRLYDGSMVEWTQDPTRPLE
jgi:thiosulfate/3-mercaptopyruvate sulfurtransferase